MIWHMTERDNSNLFSGAPTENMPSIASLIPGAQMKTMAAAWAEEFGIEQANESVPLPSRGLIYPEGHPLHKRERVEIRPMTTKDEEILLTRSFIKDGTVISRLIKACLVDKSIDVDDMIGADRNALLLAVRIVGYGPEYNIDVKCGAEDCEEPPQKFKFDLARIPIHMLDVPPAKPWTNYFECELREIKKTIGFRIMTAREEAKLVEDAAVANKNRKKLGLAPVEVTAADSLAAQIVTLDGNPDRARIQRFMAGLPAKYSVEIRAHIAAATPKAEMKQEFKCAHCGHTEEVNVPLTAEFFWPTTRRQSSDSVEVPSRKDLGT